MESQHIESGKTPRSPENTEVDIQSAVEQCDEEFLKFLLTQYKTENKSIISTSNLLSIAVKNRAVGIIQFLLDSRADVNALHDGKSPLMTTTDVNVIKLLLSRGADVNMKVSESSVIFKYPLHHFLSHNFKQKLMNSLSESESDKQTEEIIRVMLSYGACVHSRDFCNRAPLHVSADRISSSGILRLLLDSGAKVNDVDDSKETPLHKSAQIVCAENVKVLLEAGADVNALNDAGRSALFGAYEVGVFNLLLENGCDVNLEDRDGNSVFNHIIQEGLYQFSFLQYLKDIGLDVNHKNKRGYSALLLASKFVEIDLLKFLVDVGADVNAITNENKTPLNILLTKLWNRKTGAIECINYLIDHGATTENINSCVVHVLITSGSLSLIPRFISCGLAPTHLTIHKPKNSVQNNFKISPLVMALLLNHSYLAQYFISICYLMKSDMSIMSGDAIFHNMSKLFHSDDFTNIADILKTFSQEPITLQSQCFIVISDMLGSNHDRESRVQKSGLPVKLQSSLMFKNRDSHVLIDSNRRSLFHFKHSLRQLNLLHLDIDDCNDTTLASDGFESDNDDL